MKRKAKSRKELAAENVAVATAKDGEQTADFINVVAWRGTAEFIAKYFKKGSSIALVGSLQTRSWTDQS